MRGDSEAGCRGCLSQRFCVSAVGFATCRRQQSMRGYRTNQSSGGFDVGMYTRGEVQTVGNRPSTGSFRYFQFAIIKADYNDDCCL